MSRTFPRFWLLLTVALLSLLAAGCRESAREVETVEGIDMQMTVNPQPAVVGQAELLLTLTDDEGQPVAAQQIEVRGDMNHAGMVPVLRTLEEAGTGEFRVPFEWTMGGDWIVTVTATLDDNRVAVEEFELSVRSGGDATSDDAASDDDSETLRLDQMALIDIEDCDDGDEIVDDEGCTILPPDDNGLFQPVRP